MNPRLRALSGPYKDLEIPFEEQPKNIGRAENNDVVLKDNLVSNDHFQIWREGVDLLFKDLRTRNGTFVNGQPGLCRSMLAISQSLGGIEGAVET